MSFTPRPLPPASCTLSILVVEDDAGIAMILCMLLELLGFEARSAGHGAAALAALEAGPLPDALLLDIRLPSCGPDGVELARRVRAWPGGDRPAIVLMTAESYDEERTLAEAGADAFLRKPVPEGDDLAALLREAIARRRAGTAQERPARRAER